MAALLLLLSGGCRHVQHHRHLDGIAASEDGKHTQEPPARVPRLPKRIRREELEKENLHLQLLGLDGPLPGVAAHRDADVGSVFPMDLGFQPGFADLHAHVLSELGFDKRVILGGEGKCDGLWHGLRYDITGLGAGMPALLESPVFLDLLRHCPTEDVPSWWSWTHEQYPLDALRSAHERGLSLIVLSAVNNQLLCAISRGYEPDFEPRWAGWPERVPWFQCGDATNMHRQIEQVWELDALPWFHVALTPEEAQASVAAGRLTVLIGLEGSDYFDSIRYGGVGLRPSKTRTREVDPSKTVYDDCADGPDSPYDVTWWTWRCSAKKKHYRQHPEVMAGQAVGRLRNLGVSVAITAHEWNNAVSGAALQNLALFQPGYRLRKMRLRLDEAKVLDVGIGLSTFSTTLQTGKAHRWPMPGEDVEVGDGRWMVRNMEGLSGYGHHLVDQLGENQIFLDMTHLSDLAARDLVRRFEEEPGSEDRRVAPPLMVSHSTPRALSHRRRDELEYPIADGVYDFVARHDGVIGIQTAAEHVQDSDPHVANTCPGSSRSYAHMKHHVAQFSPYLAFGTDMNGGGVQVAPRFGEEACGTPRRPLAARFRDVVTCALEGGGDNPVARNGLAHVGWLPDLLEDVEHVGGSGSAGAYMSADQTIHAWLRGARVGQAPQVAPSGPPPPAAPELPSGQNASQVYAKASARGDRPLVEPPIEVSTSGASDGRSASSASAPSDPALQPRTVSDMNRALRRCGMSMDLLEELGVLDLPPSDWDRGLEGPSALAGVNIVSLLHAKGLLDLAPVGLYDASSPTSQWSSSILQLGATPGLQKPSGAHGETGQVGGPPRQQFIVETPADGLSDGIDPLPLFLGITTREDAPRALAERGVLVRVDREGLDATTIDARQSRLRRIFRRSKGATCRREE